MSRNMRNVVKKKKTYRAAHVRETGDAADEAQSNCYTSLELKDLELHPDRTRHTLLIGCGTSPPRPFHIQHSDAMEFRTRLRRGSIPSFGCNVFRLL